MAETPESRLSRAIAKGLDSKILDVNKVVGCLSQTPEAIQVAFFDLSLAYIHYMAALYDRGLLDNIPSLLRIGSICKELDS